MASGLCKEVCQVCRNRRTEIKMPSQTLLGQFTCPTVSMILGGEWTKSDESLWAKGWIHCPAGTQIKITGNPPDLCPFMVEHVVNAEDNR